MASSHKNAEAPRSARSVAREPNKPEELTSSESKTATVARGLDKHGVVSEQNGHRTLPHNVLRSISSPRTVRSRTSHEFRIENSNDCKRNQQTRRRRRTNWSQNRTLTHRATLLDQQQPTSEQEKRKISRERGDGKWRRLAHLSSAALPPLPRLLGGEEKSLLRWCRTACGAAANVQLGWQATEAACASFSGSAVRWLSAPDVADRTAPDEPSERLVSR
jgi:hypothetical protein